MLRKPRRHRQVQVDVEFPDAGKGPANAHERAARQAGEGGEPDKGGRQIAARACERGGGEAQEAGGSGQEGRQGPRQDRREERPDLPLEAGQPDKARGTDQHAQWLEEEAAEVADRSLHDRHAPKANVCRRRVRSASNFQLLFLDIWIFSFGSHFSAQSIFYI